MAKFVYRMQSILDIKNKMEEQAKMEYAQARMQLTEEEEKKQLLCMRKLQYEDAGREALRGSLSVLKIQESQEAIARMEEFILSQEEVIKKAEKKLEEKRQRLTELMQERKTQERLKEKAFEAFLAEEKARESKEIDELTSYTYGQKSED